MNLSETIAIAAKYIREGKVVAFPTETVYGLGADALNPFAVARIFELKQRPSFDPLIVHIADLDKLERLTVNPQKSAIQLAEKFWPGPLTMVLPKSGVVPDIVTSGLPSVGIRMPANEIALELIRASACPIAAPSANKFGRVSPTSAAHVKQQLPDVDFIIDGGKTTVGIESTIIQLTRRGFQVLRHGVITQEEIEALIPLDRTSRAGTVQAPGMMKAHYSPVKKMLIADKNAHLGIDKSKAGLISFSGELEAGYAKVIRVSQKLDLMEYAVRLFDAMHSFEDDQEIEIIVAEPVQESGIGRAIMDRLRKAAFPWQRGNG